MPQKYVKPKIYSVTDIIVVFVFDNHVTLVIL